MSRLGLEVSTSVEGKSVFWASAACAFTWEVSLGQGLDASCLMRHLHSGTLRRHINGQCDKALLRHVVTNLFDLTLRGEFSYQVENHQAQNK
jgi:hypothetical protein